jgi:hypothetical protein
VNNKSPGTGFTSKNLETMSGTVLITFFGHCPFILKISGANYQSIVFVRTDYLYYGVRSTGTTNDSYKSYGDRYECY